MTYEKIIGKIFSAYLNLQGYSFSEDDLYEIVDVYLDCQEWDNEKLLTGITEPEMLEWIKHTSEVDRIVTRSV